MYTAPARGGPARDWLPAPLRAGSSGSCVSSCCSGDMPQAWQNAPDGNWGAIVFPESKIQLAIQPVQLFVHPGSFRVRLDDAVLGAEGFLRLLNRGKRARGERGKDGRTEAGHIRLRYQYRLVQHVGVHAVQHLILLRNAARIDDATYGHTVVLHALENNAGVKGGALNRGKEFVLGRMREGPAEGHAAELRIHQHRAVAVIPGQAQQTGLAWPEIFESLGKLGDGLSGAPGNGIENIARGREARLDAGLLGMDRTRHDAADSGYEPRLIAHGDYAGGSADDVYNVAGARARADGIPVSVECPNRNGDASLQAQFSGPFRAEPPSELVAGFVATVQLGAHALQQRVHCHKEFFRRQSTPRSVPHPLVAHGADRSRPRGHIGNSTENRRHHIAMLEGANEFPTLFGIVAQPVQEFGKTPLRRVSSAAPVDRLKAGAVRRLRDQCSFTPAPVVTPKVILVEGREFISNRNDAGAGGIDCQRGNLAARKFRCR